MLAQSGETLIAAVSGGRDSMVLLDWLVKLGRERGFSVIAAHFNHHLRKAADSDETFVKRCAERLQIPFYSGEADVAALCREHGLSLEEGARMARYAWLEHLCRETGAAAVATAHHRADQAETVLFHLVRGTGMEGLRGIAPRWGVFIRPLLTTGREEIDAYAASHGVEHVEDESNADLRFARNRIRHDIMFRLREINPRAEEALCRTASLLTEEDAWLNEEAKRRMPDVVELERGVAVDYAAFSAMDAVLRRRGVRLLLDRLEAGKKDVTAMQLCAAAELGKGRSLTLPGEILVSVENGLFRIEQQAERPEPVVLPLEGEVRWGNWRFCCFVTDEKKEPDENTLVFSRDKITEGVTVACWEKTGRLQVGNGSRSLKRLFADAKLGVRERETVPVLYCGGSPIAVIGAAADQSYAQGNGPWWIVSAADEKE